MVAAQLAEALIRHRAGADLARQALLTVFAPSAPTHADAVARWWLAERWQALRGEPAPTNPNALTDARTHALGSSLASDAPIPAMLAEVAAQSINDLVIVPAATLAQAQATVGARTIVENLAWRVLGTVVLAAAAFVELRTMLAWLLPGSGVPPKGVLQAGAGVLTALVGVAIVMNLRRAYRRLGRPPSQNFDVLIGALTAVGAFLAVVLYK